MLAVIFAGTAYFGAYYLTADYVDVGDNTPCYILRYRIGSQSLPGFAGVFEAARRVDAALFRRRQAAVMDFRLAGETKP